MEQPVCQAAEERGSGGAAILIDQLSRASIDVTLTNAVNNGQVKIDFTINKGKDTIVCPVDAEPEAHQRRQRRERFWHLSRHPIK